MRRLLIVAASVVALCGGQHSMAASPPPKIIIDSDFGTLNDDGQLLAIAAQLQARGRVEILGLTLVSGNKWLRQETAEALKSVERLGIAQQVGVYAGANYPLSHDLATVRAEQQMHPGGDGYLGAWSRPEPRSDADLVAPPDGYASHTELREQSAAEFIADSIRRHPGEVTILAIGPLTNIALAVRRHPEIVPMIGQIIYMGGAFDVAGNTTAAAEFNWWFDPQAAREVLGLPVRHVIFPLDVTDTVKIDKQVYDRVVYGAARDGIIARLFKQLNGYGYDGRNGFETNPAYSTDVWDTLTLAYLLDQGYARRTVQRWVEIDTRVGATNGRSIGHATAQPGLQPATIVERFDNRRFFDFYVDGLTAAVPVAPSPAYTVEGK
ncbi:nucleoside hydrolase [Pseudoduganella sp. FT25W]|uniref:Nucleoside hydrolase n=1 Tax=Duganella alba TaxID=2666081 RepID=A0A6L5QG31_9BURK|nr:nucleoside hydrolase [Duganella alba]MRX08656.1 nucleoside hydrolase [Duganella alba]MRX18218.1 nucleoside hydrolase [Duganella alba]